jgi:predicted alpha-1,6-mannanase (GH76 family)
MKFFGICPAQAAMGMAALQTFYNYSTGLWNTTGWWNSANALQTNIEYTRLAQQTTYANNIFNTYEKNKQTNFLNQWFNDDDGWWALAWINAYDLTGETRYLDAAKTIFANMQQGWDSVCGGGVWWKKDRTYKNAITNELFLTVAVRLHLRTPNDRGTGSYLEWAQRSWKWFQASGMINRQNLVNDGLNNACQNNQDITWTYNQGVILGGLVDLYQATGNKTLLRQAEAIADATLHTLAPNGILQEPCETTDCGNDGPQFKGIFIRNLHYLYQTLPKPIYRDFIRQNAKAIWEQNRNAQNQLGLKWAGSFDKADAARQSAAMDAIVIGAFLNTNNLTLQAEDGALTKTVVRHAIADYRGSGYVDGQLQQGATVTFRVEIACPGKYNLVFRYAAPRGGATRYIFVGRSLVNNQPFPATQAKNNWQTVTIPNVWLESGNTDISVIFDSTKGSRNPLLLDELVLNQNQHGIGDRR